MNGDTGRYNSPEGISKVNRAALSGFLAQNELLYEILVGIRKAYGSSSIVNPTIQSLGPVYSVISEKKERLQKAGIEIKLMEEDMIALPNQSKVTVFDYRSRTSIGHIPLVNVDGFIKSIKKLIDVDRDVLAAPAV